MLDERIKQYDEEFQQVYAANQACRRLGAIEDIGPQIATAVTASYGDGKQFRNGRQFAASIGLVPRQYTTGDRPVLLGISKRGDKYLRTRPLGWGTCSRCADSMAVRTDEGNQVHEFSGWLSAPARSRAEQRPECSSGF